MTREQSLLHQCRSRFSTCKTLANFKKRNSREKHLKKFANSRDDDIAEWFESQESNQGDEEPVPQFEITIKCFTNSFLTSSPIQSVKYATSNMQCYILAPQSIIGSDKNQMGINIKKGMLLMTTEDKAEMYHKISATKAKGVSACQE